MDAVPDMNPLKAKRLAKDLTLEQAAVLSGINRGSLSRLERGEQRLDVDDLRRLAKAYDCDPALLIPPGEPAAQRALPRGVHAAKEVCQPEETPAHA